jgi:hypothetical protein
MLSFTIAIHIQFGLRLTKKNIQETVPLQVHPESDMIGRLACVRFA